MNKKYLIIIFTAVFVISVGLGFLAGKSVMDDMPKFDRNHVYAAEKDEDKKVSGDVVKIVPGTKIIYEYYYPADEETEIVEESAPYFMLGLTFKELQQNYDMWQIEYFSADKVVMKRNVYGEREQKYIVGIKDGYVAVFYDIGTDEELVREITNIFAGALPKEEREKLKNGIKVVGENNLIGILQDYSS
ncbi:MAG: BofC C-terminal domain-containing protein [Firmicutes bacterium]|nr:BofC C-terminal domain-containing protein [Bacillota bacterium]